MAGKKENHMFYSYSWGQGWIMSVKDAEVMLGILSRVHCVSEENYRDENDKSQYRFKKKDDKSELKFQVVTPESLEEMLVNFKMGDTPDD
tara:strand:- start:17185 stop:17454 length:270 start_codon:yes stop_codon:yes gene_type:complete